MKKVNLNTPVEEISGIPTRILNVCKCNNINTLGELSNISAIFWMSRRNIGIGNVQMLANVLKSYGITMQCASRFGIVTDNNADSIELSALPGRVKTACRRLGIKTVKELSMMTKKQWLDMRNIGLKNVEDTEIVLHKQGLAFAK